jgi:two-component system sensor histidine kinase QseC
MGVAPRPRRLRHYLLRWTLGVVVLIWLAVVAQAWSTSFREARKFSDGQMVAVARLWLQAAPNGAPHALPEASEGLEHEFLQNVAVLAWAGERLVSDTNGLVGALDLKALPASGFFTVQLQREGVPPDWRVFAVSKGEGAQQRRVLVLMDMRQRFELGRDIAMHVAQPALLLLPLVLLLLWWAVRRGLRPLDRLSSEVAALDGFAGQRLDPSAHRFVEFASTVSAINALVDSLQTRAQREREFASDVAHELRTPLAALALQARAAQHDASPERLAQLEHEALRAGRILHQLLDLARAQRKLAGSEGAPAVVLGELAAEVIAAHVPKAHESGHELSLQQPEQALSVHAEPMLLALALRNLIDNALSHTPRGSQVQVSVWADGTSVGVSVSDDGRRPGAALERPAESGGLGLGLRLVQRIAEQIGAVLERDEGEAPMTTRFSLRWPPEHS